MMNKVNRFERKWIFKSGNYLSLINCLIRSKLFFMSQYPKRNVNSIYFDSLDYSSIKQNLDESIVKESNSQLLILSPGQEITI